MTSSAHLRKAALAQTGAEADGDAYRVAGTVFAAHTGPATARLALHGADAAACSARYAGARADDAGVTLRLADIDGQALDHWVRRAWLACAPPGLAARAREADGAEPGTALPEAIGRPATRALANAGITTMDAVAARTDAELLALHGLGPKALRVLREAAERDR